MMYLCFFELTCFLVSFILLSGILTVDLELLQLFVFLCAHYSSGFNLCEEKLVCLVDRADPCKYFYRWKVWLGDYSFVIFRSDCVAVMTNNSAATADPQVSLEKVKDFFSCSFFQYVLHVIMDLYYNASMFDSDQLFSLPCAE